MIDCGFTKENRWFRYRAAAIIVENDCALFACNETDDYFYSIGGGVHHGETAEAAVRRDVRVPAPDKISQNSRLNDYDGRRFHPRKKRQREIGRAHV